MGLSNKRRKVLEKAFKAGYHAHKAGGSKSARHYTGMDCEEMDLWKTGFEKSEKEFWSPECIQERKRIAETTDTTKHVAKQSFLQKLKDLALRR